MEVQAKGKSFLLVTGIIDIVVAAFTLIGVAIMGISMQVLTNSAMRQQVEEQLAAQGNAGSLDAVDIQAFTIRIAFGLILTVLYMIAGIMGIKNRNKPEKAQSCLVLGAVTLVVVLIEAAYKLTQGQFSIVSVAIGCALGILYIYGAMLNKQSVATTE